MQLRYLFINSHYFHISEEKSRNLAILGHFLYDTDYDTFNINAYVIALSLFTNQSNFRNDVADLKDYKLVNDILNDFFDGKNDQYSINRKELKRIVDLCNDYRLSQEDNEKIIRQYAAYDEDAKEHLDTLLAINKQI